MSTSPTWSVYDGEWVDTETDPNNNNINNSYIPPELTLRGCGLRRQCILQRGAQGVIYMAKDTNNNNNSDNNIVAVKRLFTQSSECGPRGISEGALREATILSLLSSQLTSLKLTGEFGVVQLYNIVEAPYKELCLVLEMCPLDLSRVVLYKKRQIHSTRLLSEKTEGRCPILANINVIKYLMRGILTILHTLHNKCHIIHRDVKLSNFLIKEDGKIRIADFGSARFMHNIMEESNNNNNINKSGEYTPAAFRTTIIYQPPECLLGERAYTSAVDIWAAGVIFAELILQQHLFHTRSELEMLSNIWKLIGTPVEEEEEEEIKKKEEEEEEEEISFLTNDKNNTKIENRVTFAVQTKPTIDLKFPTSIINADGLDLLKKMLEYNPAKRITAADALSHPFLSELTENKNLEEGRMLWKNKVEMCLQEAKKSVAVEMQTLFCNNENDEDDEDDDDNYQAL